MEPPNLGCFLDVIITTHTTHHCFVAVVYGPILRPDLSVELTIAIVTIQDARHSHHAEEMPRGT